MSTALPDLAMEDSNIPTAERSALLQQLQETIGDVPPYFWAAAQICDVKALERLVKCGCEYPEILVAFVQQTYSMVSYCKKMPHSSALATNDFTGASYPRSLSQSSTPRRTPNKSAPPILGSTAATTPPAKRQKTSDSPTVLWRSQRIRDLAEERDHFSCVLTGGGNAEVAHIYPYHASKHLEEDKFGPRHHFWNMLKNFWSAEKMAAWESDLFPRGIDELGIETVSNLITMSGDAHAAWSRGAFALKPISISNDQTTLEIRFYWQEKQPNMQHTISLLTIPSSTQELDRNIGAFRNPVSLFRTEDGRRIQSGDIFRIQTDDPTNKPLPSYKLLELQWFLQRIQGMAGAAEVFDWSSYDSDSEYE
jgi:hypothetical protein